MLHNFQLAAIVQTGNEKQLFRVPLHQGLQNSLAETWNEFYEIFKNDIQEVEFDAGYKPESHERFSITQFNVPEWLDESSESASNLTSLHGRNSNLESDNEQETDNTLYNIKGIAAFAQDDNDNNNEVILFQNFSTSRIIRPGGFIFLTNDTYQTPSNAGLSLENTLRAVYLPNDNKLLFKNYRIVNTFLPLGDFYREATDQQIDEVLNHEKLMPENVEEIKSITNQWFRKRFAMLRDSGILDEYDVSQIQQYSQNCNVEIEVEEGQIKFPSEKQQAKQVLQFLNEELYRGPITDTLYETNSKRQADNG